MAGPQHPGLHPAGQCRDQPLGDVRRRRGGARGLLSRLGHLVPPQAWLAAGLDLDRSAAPFGHHLCSQPSSSQMCRILGMTSSANRVMFFLVSSCGIEPICSSACRLPTRSVLATSISLSATVAGLPAMMNPSSLRVFQFFSSAADAAMTPGWLVLMANSVLLRVR